jgi:pimeloyl-ACP methyl ester carboxylesterase
VSDGPRETVVLLHGLGRLTLSMRGLGGFLERGGYRVVNWGYRSTTAVFERFGEALRAELARLDAEPAVARIHIVGHSLGNIVARFALALEKPRKLGRVVMLAPPNRGSRTARRLGPILGRVVKPLPQLSDDPESDVNRLRPPEGLEIGVIAAADDGKVPVELTHVAGEQDHVVVPGWHTFIMDRADARAHVVEFLREGRFRRT